MRVRPPLEHSGMYVIRGTRNVHHPTMEITGTSPVLIYITISGPSGLNPEGQHNVRMGSEVLEDQARRMFSPTGSGVRIMEVGLEDMVGDNTMVSSS